MGRLDDELLVRRNIGRINTRALPVSRGAPAPPTPERPPLPASAAEYWHSEYQCTPASWTGQIRGLVLVSQGATPPLVETDPGCFNGRVVGKTVAATQSRWRNTAGFSPAVVPVGSRLYVFAVNRCHVNTGGLQILVCITQGFASGATGFLGTNATKAVAQFEGRGQLQGQVEASSAAHFSEYWLDGTNQNLQGEQNTLTQLANGGVSTTAANAITIGATPSGSGVYNASHAFYLFCTDTPTLAERDALKAYARSYWGIA